MQEEHNFLNFLACCHLSVQMLTQRVSNILTQLFLIKREKNKNMDLSNILLLHKNCPNTELFKVGIFLYSVRLQKIQIRNNSV